MHLYIKWATIAILFIFAVSPMTVQAATKTWNTTTGDWSVGGNWTGGLPDAGDDVVINNAGAFVTLTTSTPNLSSLTLGTGTLSCSNWDTTISATNVTIQNAGILTCAGPFTNNAMSNRVNVICYSTLSVLPGGSINVMGKGYAGGIQNAGWPTWNANGPGACPAVTYPGGAGGDGGGGGYGGAAVAMSGILPNPVTVYGSASAPLFPGSGGAAGYWSGSLGGNGGGAVCITAAQVVVSGSINADASPYVGGLHCSGGSGGGIYITCTTITGTNGTISANGTDGNSEGGGGGGGRIAVRYNTSSQSGVPVPAIRFSAASGVGSGAVAAYADPGTLYFDDTYFLSPTNLFTGQWIVPGFTNWSVADLQVSNVWIRLPGAFQLTVSNALTVVGTSYGAHRLELTNASVVNCGSCQISGSSLRLGGDPLGWAGTVSGPLLNCTGNLTLANAGRLYVTAGLSGAGLEAGYGGAVNVGGTISVANTCWIYPATHPTNGAAVLFRMRDLTLDNGGGINADYRGYIGSRWQGSANNPAGAFGPGSMGGSLSGNGCGSGYGGAGGRSRYLSPGGPVYGSAYRPVAPGSGSYQWSGGAPYCGPGHDGGGSVQIRATNTITIQGIITANGASGGWPNGAGASGGSIYLTCSSFVGNASGVLSANGGNGLVDATYGAAGGGGGRIAVWREVDNSPSTIATAVNGGTGGYSALDEPGGNGTVVFVSSLHTPNMWNATGTGDWSVAENWTLGVPIAGDDVAIDGATVLLTNSTPWLNSLTVGGATLSCSNWDTTIFANDVTILGTLTCVGPFTNSAMSNRVAIVCASNLLIGASGSIDVTGKGYAGGIQNAVWPTWIANGPGACPAALYIGAVGDYGGGAGYGGAGAAYGAMLPNAVTVCGSAAAPLFPGSGGAAGQYTGSIGGNGGGAVCITAAQVVVNGRIVADASAAGGSSTIQCSGGSGGGIYITCSTITGSNGVITANGSDGGWSYGGAGGGGRIAVHYSPSAQTNLPVPTIRFSVAGGLGGDGSTYADLGTLYFDDNYFLSPTNLFTCQWVVPGFTNWSVANLLVSNTWTRLAGVSQLTVSNTLTVVGAGWNKHRLELTNASVLNCGTCRISNASLRLGGNPTSQRGTLGGPTMNCSGDVALTNAGRLYVSAGLSTLGGGTNYGAIVNVSGTVLIPSNCWIYPAAHPTNGTPVVFNVRNLTLNGYGGINADYLGYLGGRMNGTTVPDRSGPGMFWPYGYDGSSYGAGHGGVGGTGQRDWSASGATGGGSVYGSTTAPVTAGSGSDAFSGAGLGVGNGADGGGSVQIRASDTVAIQGTITANGMAGRNYWGAGASGGGIYIRCGNFIGDSAGILQANGGAGQVSDATWSTGGGGGGRIAVWRVNDRSISAIQTTVTGGASGGAPKCQAGADGTIYWGWLPPPGTIMQFR